MRVLEFFSAKILASRAARIQVSLKMGSTLNGRESIDSSRNLCKNINGFTQPLIKFTSHLIVTYMLPKVYLSHSNDHFCFSFCLNLNIYVNVRNPLNIILVSQWRAKATWKCIRYFSILERECQAKHSLVQGALSAVFFLLLLLLFLSFFLLLLLLLLSLFLYHPRPICRANSARLIERNMKPWQFPIHKILHTQCHASQDCKLSHSEIY